MHTDRHGATLPTAKLGANEFLPNFQLFFITIQSQASVKNLNENFLVQQSIELLFRDSNFQDNNKRVSSQTLTWQRFSVQCSNIFLYFLSQLLILFLVF